MKKRKQIICAIILAACSTSACSGTIYHSRSISGSSIDFVDARQRAIIVHGEPKNGQTGGGGFATCSEPQPDVFTAMAASLGLDVGLAPQSGTDTARVAAAISENAATISRTQTINLLRESFFRTCERYLRGTPSPEMIVQAARDQRVMVSVLAIEQLTGTITPAPTIIRTSSNASLAADAGKVIDALNTARADATSAETKAAADDAAAKALDTSNACPTIRKIDSATRTEDQNTKLGECDTASTKAKASRAAATNALAHYDALRSVAGTASGASAGASGTGDLPSPGTQPTAADRAAVANAVARIVDSTFQFDEFTMLCVRVLSATAQPGEAELRAKCLELMT